MKVSVYSGTVYGRKQVQPSVSGYVYCPYPYLHSYLYLRLYCDKYIRAESTKSSAVAIKTSAGSCKTSNSCAFLSIFL